MTDWIFGQAPGRTGDPARPLDGRAGGRLAALLGASTYEELAARFHLRNVLDKYPGPKGRKGDDFPPGLARRAAIAHKRKFHPGDRVVLLGLGVAAAFQVPGPLLSRWLVRGGPHYLIAPHPSGVSLVWNDPAFVLRVRRALVEHLS